MTMTPIPALWEGYGVGRRTGQGIYWDRVADHPHALRFFLTAGAVMAPICIAPLPPTVTEAWWGAWDIAHERWAFVAPSRTALGIYFPYALSSYREDYAFWPIRITIRDAAACSD